MYTRSHIVEYTYMCTFTTYCSCEYNNTYVRIYCVYVQYVQYVHYVLYVLYVLYICACAEHSGIHVL